jgi:hypothetical protein
MIPDRRNTGNALALVEKWLLEVGFKRVSDLSSIYVQMLRIRSEKNLEEK